MQSDGFDVQQYFMEKLERVKALSGRGDSSTISETSAFSKKQNVICNIAIELHDKLNDFLLQMCDDRDLLFVA